MFWQKSRPINYYLPKYVYARLYEYMERVIYVLVAFFTALFLATYTQFANLMKLHTVAIEFNCNQY